MKRYTVSIDIDLPRAKVIELFDNPDNLFKWQTGLQSFEHVSGEPGTEGAKSKLVYISGKHTIELTETITRNALPDEFNGRFEWDSGSNTLDNTFVELGENRTRWESTCDYKFCSLMPRLMGTLMPFLFKRQNMKFMTNFKAFCETGADVREK